MSYTDPHESSKFSPLSIAHFTSELLRVLFLVSLTNQYVAKSSILCFVEGTAIEMKERKKLFAYECGNNSDKEEEREKEEKKTL